MEKLPDPADGSISSLLLLPFALSSEEKLKARLLLWWWWLLLLLLVVVVVFAAALVARLSPSKAWNATSITVSLCVPLPCGQKEQQQQLYQLESQDITVQSHDHHYHKLVPTLWIEPPAM